MPFLSSHFPVELGFVGDPEAQVGRLHLLLLQAQAGASFTSWGEVRVWLLERPVGARSRGSREAAASVGQSTVLYQAPTVCQALLSVMEM